MTLQAFFKGKLDGYKNNNFFSGNRTRESRNCAKVTVCI